MSDGAGKEGLGPSRVTGGEESAGQAAVEGDAGADGVRRQLAAAADLAAAQLARELDDALRRHAATLEARTPAHFHLRWQVPGAGPDSAVIGETMLHDRSAVINC